jgi:uncharacterized protein (TIGR03437 family)
VHSKNSVSLLAISILSFADNTVIGTGYSVPYVTPIAPGQIIRLVVQGVGTALTQKVSADKYPLPTVLSGISIEFRQDMTNGSLMFQLPIVSVEPRLCPYFLTQECGTPSAIIVAQVPFEINAPGLLPDGSSDGGSPGFLIVSENGVPGAPLPVVTAFDNIHIVAIVHATDGTPVGPGNGATPGEYLVMFAYGLGQGAPKTKTGEPAPIPLSTSPPGTSPITYDFRHNAPPYRGSLPRIAPSFIGLAPGYAGLYQINFQAPEPPPGDLGCPLGGPLSNVPIYASNVTVNYVGSASFDGVGICVNPVQ